MVAGLVSLSGRALERTAVAVAAGALRVSTSSVRVRLADESGLLGIKVTAPLRVAPLRGTAAADEPVAPGIVTRVQSARQDIRAEMAALTGRVIGRVDVSITRAEVTEEKRVR